MYTKNKSLLTFLNLESVVSCGSIKNINWKEGNHCFYTPSASRFFNKTIYQSFNLLLIKKRRNSRKTQSHVNFSKGFVICVLVLLVASFALSFWFKIKPMVIKLLRTKRKVTIFWITFHSFSIKDGRIFFKIQINYWLVLVKKRSLRQDQEE